MKLWSFTVDMGACYVVATSREVPLRLAMEWYGEEFAEQEIDPADLIAMVHPDTHIELCASELIWHEDEAETEGSIDKAWMALPNGVSMAIGASARQWTALLRSDVLVRPPG